MLNQFILRVRQPNGTWKFELDDPMPKSEANLKAKQSRILLGTLTQVWPEKEAREVVAKSQKS